jgi:uncharacterized protein (TIGR03086 family)
MDNLLANFNRSIDLFGERVAAVGADQWDEPTPCREWTIGQLVDHVTDEHLWMPPLLGGHDLAAAEKIVAGAKESSGPDRAANWQSAAIGSRQATAEPDALSRTVSLSRGPTPAQQYVLEMYFDAVVHSWDLGRAIGFAQPIPEELAESVYDLARVMSGELAASGLFAPPVEVPGDASAMDRLAGLTGRDPR